jgi:hypothetical protein
MTEATDNVAPEGVAPDAEATGVETNDRPEWLPEKFKTPEDLVTSYSALEGKLGKGEEELKKALAEEFEASKYENRPESAGDYTLPEGTEDLADDPNIDWWSKLAWEKGMSQEEFEQGLSQFIGEGPDLEAEAAKLGDNAEARIEAVALWAKKTVPEDFSDEVIRLGETAEGIQLLEFLMGEMQGQSVSSEETATTGLSKGELESMMKDPRYWNNVQRDAEFVKQVDEGFAKLYK